MYSQVKTEIFKILNAKEDSLAALLFNYFIIFLIIVNISILIFESFSSIYNDIFQVIEYYTVTIFTIEFLARLWTANLLYPKKNWFASRIYFIFTFFALIDLIAILPFFLPLLIPVNLISLRSLRLLRLLRLLKLTRHTTALLTIATVLKNKSYQLVSSMSIVILIIIIASIVMYHIESVAQPQAFNNAFSSFWWAVATITTVGYGDIYPVTVIGRLISAIISFLGVAIVAIPTGIISAGFNELTEKDHSEEYRFCPFCGNKIK